MWYDLQDLQLQVVVCVWCHVKLGATRRPLLLLWSVCFSTSPFQRRCGAASAPQPRCPWRCGSSRTLIVLWQCRSCWELGDRWSKDPNILRIYTSCRVFRFGSVGFFKGLFPEVGQWIGMEYESNKNQRWSTCLQTKITSEASSNTFSNCSYSLKLGWGEKSLVDSGIILHNLSPMT